MERVWTPEQRAAIDTRDRTLLVSAAAGSGKTAVLTERIIRSLCDKENPLDLTRLLVVTFTRAAATEMRTRIGRAIGDALALDPQSKHLAKQLILLGSARISTIDSFYLDLVRANFEAAGMSPAFRLVDESELLSLRGEIMNRVIDRMYREESGFIAVAELLSGVKIESKEDVAKAADKLMEMGVHRLFISLGGDGVLAAMGEEKLWLPNLPGNMVNTTGCGDSFTAAIVWAYLEGKDLRSTAMAGLAAGSITMESHETINPAMSAELLKERLN